VIAVGLWFTQGTDPAATWRRELAAAADLLAAGDVGGAEQSLLRAEQAADVPSMRAVALEQLARLRLAQGALDAARADATQAIAALSGAPAADPALSAASLSTLALIERRREDWMAAADAYGRAAAAWRLAAGPAHANVAEMLTGQGLMMMAGVMLIE
jgi:hypothetical protein